MQIWNNRRSWSFEFAVGWALVLAHICYACASGDPGDESVGEISQALCQPQDLHCNGVCCTIANGACCGSQCINSSKTTCCGGVICPANKDHCVDGVCCETACSGTCQACSAAAKGSGVDGTCGNIVAGSDPNNECTPAALSCATGDYCNGAGACQKASASTPCATTACSNGTVTGSLCNGSGTCISSSSSCNPYFCANATSCATTCSSDNDCVANAFCRTSDHTCQSDRANGLSCSGGSQCVSGNCVDGVCCDDPCNGSCEACTAAKKGSGADGTCANVAEDSDPDSECPDDGGATCKRNGDCDGSGGCKKYDSGTSCGSTTCTSGQQSGHSCDGLGSCLDSNVTQCSPYLCSGNACGTTCTSDANCIASSYCRTSDKTCQPDQANGKGCSAASQCSSGKCVDGVCCDTACDGTCDACTAAKKGGGSDGTCGPIAVDTDPDGDCGDDGAASCKKNGT
jgi:hypothetical protein